MESPKDETSTTPCEGDILSLDSGHSEELKPSCPERKEHIDSDDGQIMDQFQSDQFHSDENSDILMTKTFREGNVVVQPEPKQKEDKDDFQGLEVSTKSKMKIESSKRHVGERLHEIVSCTACGQQVNHYEDSVYRHPVLNVLICKMVHKRQKLIFLLFLP
ncbi:transcriptional regulator ATRX-like isoform X3 [Sminthopsis crassicaudata]|uniref:transcriptional regulator ATRX-like isoform X3 n=1 Tax=Sminthopsis crassicaudata TaxID=9301 RepID=UPI003D69EDEA